MATVSISCPDAYIGASTQIKVEYSATVLLAKAVYEWEFGSQSGQLESKYPNPVQIKKDFHNWVLPTTFYNEIPNASSGIGVIRLTAYGENNIVIASATCNFTAKVNPSTSAPTISVPSVRDANAHAAGLTGDASIIIRHVSNPRITFNVSARNGSTIAETYVTNDGKKLWGKDVTFNAASSMIFNVVTRDSRGLQTAITYTIPDERVIEYTKLTCNMGNERPDTNGDIRLTCSGNYWDGNFGGTENFLAVECRYREKGGEWGAWHTMDARIGNGTYSASASLTGFNYTTTYEFECRATDATMTVSSAADARALPNFHWGENDFVHETVVDFRAGIMFNGVEGDYIEEQGETGVWTWRKWHSGLAECWGQFTKSVYGTDWTKWGALYQAEIIMNEAYPFTFAELPIETATLCGLSGGLLNGSMLGRSYSTTAAYFAVHPNQLTSTYSFALNLYLCGRWK